MGSVYRALDNDITINDNMAASIKKISFTTRSGYGIEPWLANKTYAVGDIVLYSGAGYSCSTANTDAIWTVGKWTALTSTAITKLTNWEDQKIFNPLANKPVGVVIVKSVDLTYYNPITDPVSIYWNYLDGYITINYITGLKPSNKYEFNLLIL